MLLFLPPRFQALIGVVVMVIGLVALHSFIVAGLGAVGLAIGAGRWIHSRRNGEVHQ